jgi:hypothetical protein
VSQIGYQCQMDDNQEFKSIDYDSKITTSSQNTFIPTTQIPDGIWYWRLRTCDSDSGWGEYCNSMKILIDTKPPESMIISPQNNSFYKQMNLIEGTALDPDVCSGINRTELFIKQLSDNKYWTGLEWISDQLWLSTTGIEHWKYNSNLVNWTSKESYLIQSRAFDNATNQEIIGTGVVFKYDTDPPISLVEIPVNNSAYNNLNIISGKTYDIGGCGVKDVKIMVKAQETSKYWNGKKWVNTKTWLTATGNSTWSYDSKDVLWENGEIHIITSRATDKLDNIEIIPKSNTFIFDIIRPYSTVQYPGENSYLNSVDTIFGNATDIGGSGIANVEISIKDRSSNQYWNGNLWQGQEFWLTTNGTDNWAYNASSISWTSDVYYQIYSKAIDKAGNYMVSEPGNTFMYDAKPPEVSFFINDDARYTNSTTITLTIYASDTGSGESQMWFSLDGVQWSNWEQYSNDKVLDLPSDDGEKIVYLRISDKANNTAEPVCEKIILDTEPPIGSIIVNNDNKFTNSKDIIITLTGSDILSGVKDMSFSTDNLTWSPWEPFSKTGSYTLSGSDGEKMVYSRLRDQAGNIGITSDMIILDTTPPSMLEIIINDGTLSTERTEVTLKLTASDQLSGVDKMSFCTLDQNWSSWEDFSDIRSYNLTTENGEKQIFYRVKDKAGNIAVPASARITLVLPTPETQKQKPDDTNWFLLILIIIIIIILILLISIKMIVNKKKRNKSISSEGQDLNQDQPEDSSSNFSENGDIEESLTATNEPEQLSTVTEIPELDTDVKQLPPAKLEKQHGSYDEDVTK